MKHIHGEVQTEKNCVEINAEEWEISNAKISSGFTASSRKLKNSFNGVNSMLASPELP